MSLNYARCYSALLKILVLSVFSLAACGSAESPTPVLGPPAYVINEQPTTSFVSTWDDPYSTFALDVDTASYTVARNYIQAEKLPPSETVRVEEFINYFKYDYPVPEHGVFSIFVDAAPSPWARETGLTTQIVRVGIQGRRILEKQRANAALTFVIDISGSMNEPNRLPLVKETLRMLVEELRDSDKVGIVVYNDSARVVFEHVSGKQRNEIMKTIYALAPGGSTNVEGGLRLGYELASRGIDLDATNRVILFSDGIANVGLTDPDGILQMVSEYTGQGILLTTVGFGIGDYNDHLMERLADDGNGQYAYIDTLSEAKHVFVENLTGTLEVIALDAKIQIEFNPRIVERYRLIGYENREIADEDFRNDRVDAGEVGVGHSVTALYEVILSEQDSGTAISVRLRYIDTSTGKPQVIEQSFDRNEFEQDFVDASPHFQLAAVVAEFAERLQGKSYEHARSLNDLQTAASRLGSELSSDQDVQEFVRLVTLAKQLWGK
jgi:Ca-activated chloride channel family protein